MDLNNNLIINEDENSNHSNNSDMPRRERSSSDIRKSNKPLMEKRRRERINKCLDQLKAILMEVTKKESSYYSKLEKADILEMTVKYLKNMKKPQVSTDPAVLSKYVAGFNECSSEVTKYLSNVDGLSTDVKGRMLSHLANCLTPTSRAPTNIQISRQQAPSATSLSALPGSSNVCILNSGMPTVSATPCMQLLPAKLPTGETVYLLANSNGATSPTSLPSPTQVNQQPLSPPTAHVSPTSTITNSSFSSSSDGSFLSSSDTSISDSPLNLDTKRERLVSPIAFTPIAPKKTITIVPEKENQHLAENLSFKKSPSALDNHPQGLFGNVNSPPLHLFNAQSRSMWRPW
ncbi:hypothetical protein CAPTEDRAFT_223641 [Capitella teleta]|uniref:BHLH domain-containing protein n=1 Tax=Capitella teleta TaxID=283909 RepID=R7UWW0_CAPTE|nr:hypothetical protein CAPTEDRAFT_223641 [Capitella teleta]|eukprot:ELU10814.1 hypothetical protein CAPTEDRAFT_223641 [Capitella teleta]